MVGMIRQTGAAVGEGGWDADIRLRAWTGQRFSLPVSTTTPFCEIIIPGKNRNQNAFSLNSAIKSGRTRFVSILRLNLIKKF